jgi:hypothetical protein
VKLGLPPAGVHMLRHAAAKPRRDAGKSAEEVSRFLDHSSLAVTTVCLRGLEGDEERHWRKVAAAIGAQDGWRRLVGWPLPPRMYGNGRAGLQLSFVTPQLSQYVTISAGLRVVGPNRWL